jgi:hypothetical protein
MFIDVPAIGESMSLTAIVQEDATPMPMRPPFGLDERPGVRRQPSSFLILGSAELLA